MIGPSGDNEDHIEMNSRAQADISQRYSCDSILGMFKYDWTISLESGVIRSKSRRLGTLYPLSSLSNYFCENSINCVEKIRRRNSTNTLNYLDMIESPNTHEVMVNPNSISSNQSALTTLPNICVFNIIS